MPGANGRLARGRWLTKRYSKKSRRRIKPALYNGRRSGDPTWQKYDAAWEQAAALKERVITTLQAATVEKGFKVCAAGVIDLGEIRPLRATRKTDPISTK